MGVEIKQAVSEALEHRLFPAMARWLAEAGVSVQEAIDLLRAAAIADARGSMAEGVDRDTIPAISARTISAISAKTGISRRLVRKILAAAKGGGKTAPRSGHRGERVLDGWWHDMEFRDQKGQPRILEINKGPHSFEALCRRYSGERQYRTILNDLVEVGAVTLIAPDDRVQVLRQSYAAVGWTAAGQSAMAEQLAEHIETCLHNFKHPEGSQHWVCRRVANALVRPEYARILARDLRLQIDSQVDSYYDALTDPQYTAEPLDPQAERISVTFYVNRKTGAAGPPIGPPEGSSAHEADSAPVALAQTPQTRRTPRRRSAKRRGGSKRT